MNSFKDVIEKLGENNRFSTATLARAERVTDMRQDKTYSRVFWVPAGSNPDREYRVQLGSRDGTGIWISCTCPHGLHTPLDRTACYHAARALYEGAQNGMEDVRDV